MVVVVLFFIFSMKIGDNPSSKDLLISLPPPSRDFTLSQRGRRWDINAPIYHPLLNNDLLLSLEDIDLPQRWSDVRPQHWSMRANCAVVV